MTMIARLNSRWSPLAALAATACLVANSFWLSHNIRQVIDASEWVEHETEVQLELARLESELLNAETGQRGYILTANPAFLAPYYEGQARALVRLSRVAGVTDLEAGLSGQLDELTATITEKFDEMALSLSLMQAEGQAEAREQVASANGKLLMDRIRTLIGAMRTTTERELADRRAAFEAAQFQLYGALAVFVIGSLLLIGLLVYVTRQELLRRTRDAVEIEGYARSLNASVAELKRERNEIRALNDAAGYMQSCDTIPELTALLSPTLARMFSDFQGQVLVHAPSRNRLDCVAAFGGAPTLGAVAPSECWALRRGQDHRREKGGTAPLCSHLTDISGKGGVGTLCVPLVAHGDTIGLLTLTLKCPENREHKEVEEAELLDQAQRLAETMGAQLGLTIANLRMRESLRQQAIRDPLTDAFNRRYLDAIGDKILAQSARFGQQLAVVMIDVDHFKHYNDLHGHVAGDQALIAVSGFIQSRIREADWLFRYGGEEFLLIMQGLDAEDAREKLDALRAEISEFQFTNGDGVLPAVTISLGCAIFPDQARDLPELIAMADGALYEAKHNGRNRLEFAAGAPAADEGETVLPAGLLRSA
ncbi:sensor domain-containing diguanylate cyclase [Pelagibacterium montanilacus]|uniref:sensor domain-containing diguanylate cyclase n=1 Tax=Pelagibacterium montanilacus TaxID=2185280 RepID=UPI0013DF4BA0|nr:diguanylate cyclase [Pelagibacterium montanilacus]